MSPNLRRPIARACTLLTLLASVTPARAGAPADDLKQIEYRYYFRGRYPQAIEALQIFLARVDVEGAVALRANEFLAASHVLSGSPQAGREVFVGLITAHPAYSGPDPAVFKPEVVDVYSAARSEYASLALHHAAPADTLLSTTAGDAPAPATAPTATKPIYKKWWFYAGAAAVAGVVAGLAASGGDDAGPRDTGTVLVGVTVH